MMRKTLEFVNSRDFAALAAMGNFRVPIIFLRTKIAPLALDPARIDDPEYLAGQGAGVPARV